MGAKCTLQNFVGAMAPRLTHPHVPHGFLTFFTRLKIYLPSHNYYKFYPACHDLFYNVFEKESKFSGEMTSLTCPEQKCTSQALPTQVKALVSDKNFQLYEKVLLATTLESMADIVLCPRKDCQCPTIIDREANMGQCPNCTFVFCIYCKATFHGVAPCR